MGQEVIMRIRLEAPESAAYLKLSNLRQNPWPKG